MKPTKWHCEVSKIKKIILSFAEKNFFRPAQTGANRRGPAQTGADRRGPAQTGADRLFSVLTLSLLVRISVKL